MNIGFIISNNETGIRLSSDDDILPEDTDLIVNHITDGNTFDTAKTALSDLASKMYVYDIFLKSNGIEIQPNGKVKVSIPLPNDVDASKLIVCRITDTGEKIEYTATIETINEVKYATFETDHFSTYVLAEKTETASKEQQEDLDKEDNTKAPGILPQAGVGVGLAVVIIVSVGISVLVYIKYRDVKDI